MTEDTVEMDMGWGGSLRDFFSTAYTRGKATILRKPRVSILQVRPVTTDAQSFDVLGNASGLFTNPNYLSRLAIDVSGVVGNLDNTMDVGDVRDFFAVGGGADAIGGIANTAQRYLLVVEYIRLYLVAAAAVANRTMSLNYRGGTAQIAAWPAVVGEFVSTTSAAVTAGLYGAVFEHGNGVETTNVAGAVTTVAGRSPFPMLVDGVQLTQISSKIGRAHV